jgi:SAM-dependent methyltransferase
MEDWVAAPCPIRGVPLPIEPTRRIMSSHLYSSFLGRVRWFAERFGASEMLFKPLRIVFAPVIIPFLKAKQFQFCGRTYACHYARYNMTWAGERMVEIPIGLGILEQHRGHRVLEVGNVLHHYARTTHTVVDKFERGEGIINTDILDYRPEEKFGLILSISTFEHIGFDDESTGSSGEKIREAVEHCRSLLAPGGRFVMTVPTGYNPELDQLMREGTLGPCKVNGLIRVGRRDWVEGSMEQALRHPYRSRYPYANAVLIVEVSGPQ